MRILITGDGGFVGRHLCAGLTRYGHEVFGLRAVQGQIGLSAPRFGDALTPTLDALRPDLVVHCAFKRYDPDGGANRQGTAAWAAECHQAGQIKQIFISSVSAELESSVYGRSKAELEQIFAGFGAVSLRLGLVMGDGGVFATIAGLLKTFHFFPLLNRGRTPISPLLVSFIPQAVERVFKDYDSLSGQVKSLYEPGDLIMKQFLSQMARELGIRYVGLPCPFTVLNMPVWMLETLLAERAPITRDNLMGLKAGVRPAQASWLCELLPGRPDFNEQLRTALKMFSDTDSHLE